MQTEFSAEEYELAYPDGVENNYWTIARCFILYKNILKASVQNEKIIEVGCGRGGVVKYLRGKSVDIFGVELATCTPHKGVEDFIQTKTNALNINKDERDKYTVLMLLDVIEHIENPDSFIKEILGRYKNVKTIILTVPARQEIWSNYDEFYGHYKRYDTGMCKKLSEKIDFDVRLNRYFFSTLYLVAKVLMNFSKNRSVKISSPKGIMKISHNVIAYLLIIEYYLVPGSWKGTSIINVLNKSYK